MCAVGNSNHYRGPIKGSVTKGSILESGPKGADNR